MHIDSHFDSGNIEVVDITDDAHAKLRIRKDAGDEHMQWFYFRVDGAAGKACTLQIINAGDASYPRAWNGYRVCTSVDRENWTRVDTEFEDGVLTIAHMPEAQMQWYAYFAPHTHEQHLDLLAQCQLSDLVTVDRLGATVDGRDLHRLVVGNGPLKFWVIARQHPGESMASWWMEGFLGRLLDSNDAISRNLRELATIHIVPHMNPDGAIRGHLRCNAAGANLNREWAEPTIERSPEVYYTRAAMDKSGVNFCLDVHGDEELPYNFLSGAEGIPGYETTRIPELCEVFAAAYQRANPDLQREHGYPIASPGQANLKMCTNAVAHRFQCPAYTLEMPFKDNDNAPDPIFGWSPERCIQLGASGLDALILLAEAFSAIE
ncbi:MAG: M14-type cytosolic carboxypeptidase [Myxococcota bacterium]|nr:M14-type cytosolic carboxypeptidase [Myxococcota bacterium]